MQFTHLHCHSHFSFYNGTASPEELVRRASELNMSALALTDFCNLNGIPEFCRAAKNRGIKPILGIELVVDGYGLTLLAMNEEGWENLIHLSSLAQCESPHDALNIDKESLRKHNAGLICLSGFAGGEVGRFLTDDPAGGYEKAKTAAQWFQDTFGDRYYLELRNHGIESQQTLFDQTVALGKELGILTVATNDIHYLDQADWKAHDILLCQKNGETILDTDRPKMGSVQHYFRSADEMDTVFAEHREAAQRTVEIADRVEEFAAIMPVLRSEPQS
jgi:DNA polymerase-3 subunit alpha